MFAGAPKQKLRNVLFFCRQPSVTATVTGPAFKPRFSFECLCFSFGCGRGGGVGVWGEVKNVIRIVAMPQFGIYSTSPLRQHAAQGCGARHVVTNIHVSGDHAGNAGVFSVFAFCTTHCASMWNKKRYHKCPLLWRPCRQHWYLQQVCLCVQHTVQGCGTRHIVTSVNLGRPLQEV